MPLAYARPSGASAAFCSQPFRMDRFDDTKQRVKDATDLVALLEGYLALRPRGRTLVALCPFHQEKSPSFTVYPDSQHYHCYGCRKSGDVFTWMMDREGYSFREAFEVLADRAGISLEGVFRAGREERRGPDPHQVLGEVRSFFQMQLQSAGGEVAREYLQSRGLSDAIDPFGLGYHPAESGALQAFAARRNLPRDVLDQAGLLKSGGHEPLAGRLIFPIEDERGRVVAFGGRILPGAPERGDRKPPKYLNSPESPFFSKRRLLFGLHRVKQAGTRRIVVVEGYTDVIACHLAGFTGAVATLGTAFTAEHARVLERYATEGVVLLFDADSAGDRAAQRALAELVDSQLQVCIALMGDAAAGDGGPVKDPGDALVARPGDDPDAVAARRVAFADLLAEAHDAVSVWFRLLRKRLDLTQAVHVEAAARECARLLEGVSQPLRQQALVQEMARHLAMPPDSLARLLRRSAAPRPGSVPAAVAPDQGGSQAGAADGAAAGTSAGKPSPAQKADLELLVGVLASPERLLEWDGEAWEFPPVVELLAMSREGVQRGRTSRADLVRYLFTCCSERPDLGRVLAWAADRAGHVTDPAAFWTALHQGRQRAAAGLSARRTRQQLQEALARGDRDLADELTRRLVDEMRAGRPRRVAADDGVATAPDNPPPT